jgi:hypothetical protein
MSKAEFQVYASGWTIREMQGLRPCPVRMAMDAAALTGLAAMVEKALPVATSGACSTRGEA